ncbi:MAG: protein kinase [Planctomycetes bacterium]|nr:protein kinase [Planctomycetota bacterium]
MSSLDAGMMADNAVRLGLLANHQAEEAWEELGNRKGSPTEFLRAMERRGYLTPFQSSKLTRGDRDGFFLGGYRILYKIASGSFGRVYRADDPSSGRVVAIKVLRKKWSEDKHKIELFMREGKMGMSLRHPNIVEILAVNQEASTNQYYIIMEFVEGGNLRDFLQIRKKLTPPDVLRILEDTAAGLAHAFAQGVTHRDMKLTNVLLSSQGPAKLVDFGLAGAKVGAGGNIGRVGEEKEEVSVDRTVDYAGLERVTGAPHGDPRSDIFFLGCLAYELLTGRTPLEYPRSQRERMAPKRFENIVPLSPADAPAPVARLVENMMMLQPDLRIQTAAQLFERIRECRAEHGGAGVGTAAKKGQATIFLAESDESLQDVLRTKLKEEGFRILIAADPTRALDRFRLQPFDLLIVDAATTGESGYYVFERIMEDAMRQEIPCGGILMLTESQLEWQKRIAEFPGATALIQPVKYRQLLKSIRAYLGDSVQRAEA